MKMLFSLRELLFYDPFEHSGVYDSEESGIYWTPDGIKKARQIGKIARLQLQLCLKDEPSVETAITELLVEGAGRPGRVRSFKGASEQLRGCGVVLMNPKTLMSWRKAEEDWRMDRNVFHVRTPQQLKPLFDFLMPLRKWATHPKVPENQLIGIKGHPEDLGILNCPNYFPYPAGVGLYRTEGLRTVKIVPVSYRPVS